MEASKNFNQKRLSISKSLAPCYYFLNFRLKMARPAKPPPTNNIVAGSGTGAGAWGRSLFFPFRVLYFTQEGFFFLTEFLSL